MEKKPVAKPVAEKKKEGAAAEPNKTAFDMLDASSFDYVPQISIPVARHTELLGYLFEKIGNLFITPAQTV